MAYVGDVMPYERRQQVLARFLSGQMLGRLSARSPAACIGDHFGWRTVFFMLAALLAAAALGLFYELVAQADHAGEPPDAQPGRGLIADYRKRAALAPGRDFIIVVVFFEAAIFFGAFTYVAADLHLRFGFSFTLVGLVRRRLRRRRR